MTLAHIGELISEGGDMAAGKEHEDGADDFVLDSYLEALWDEGAAPLRNTGYHQFGRALTGGDFPLAIWDSEGQILLANQLAADLAGAPLEDLIGHRLTDFVLPRDATTRVIDGVASGALDGFRSKVTFARAGRGNVPAWVWTRVVELDGTRGAVTLAIAANEIGRLARRTVAPWRDLVPVAVGVADSEGRIKDVSGGIVDVVGLTPAECAGSLFVDFVHPDDVAKLGSLRWGFSGQPLSRNGIRLAHHDGSWAEACVLAARRRGSPGDAAFALVGAPRPTTASHLDRVGELELHLRRIGAEVSAAGLIDGVRELPAPGDHPTLQALTSRQRDILNRLLGGSRVRTIADELFLNPSTIRYYLAAIFRKFGVHSQAELLEALRRGTKADRRA
jgi:PAS domain-containing protein/DNA-binding CsgD family transcriptional regulator